MHSDSTLGQRQTLHAPRLVRAVGGVPVTRLALSALLVCAKATVVVGVSFALFIGSGVVANVVNRMVAP